MGTFDGRTCKNHDPNRLQSGLHAIDKLLKILLFSYEVSIDVCTMYNDFFILWYVFYDSPQYYCCIYFYINKMTKDTIEIHPANE